MKKRPLEIDESSINHHTYLSPDDSCWYFGDYTAKKKYDYSDMNQLVANFKKKPSTKGTKQWHYKQKATAEVGELFSWTFKDLAIDRMAIIPIPPSKVKGDPEYDPRLNQALDHASTLLGRELPVLDVISQRESSVPSHQSDAKRLTPEERAASYQVELKGVPRELSGVVLVDDVITTGSHYKGAEMVLKQSFPGIKVFGLFLARTVRLCPFESFGFEVQDPRKS